mmetsp:Transcript_36813/g.59531  ORF Transcript_36813/g.59531 Transcript_36813/m.59531 type:complete len:97 (+) Transcript_36813:341-631(+)
MESLPDAVLLLILQKTKGTDSRAELHEWLCRTGSLWTPYDFYVKDCMMWIVCFDTTLPVQDLEDFSPSEITYAFDTLGGHVKDIDRIGRKAYADWS